MLQPPRAWQRSSCIHDGTETVSQELLCTCRVAAITYNLKRVGVVVDSLWHLQRTGDVWVTDLVSWAVSTPWGKRGTVSLT